MIHEAASQWYSIGVLTVKGKLEYEIQLTLEGVGTLIAQEAIVPGAVILTGVGTLSVTTRSVHVINVSDIQEFSIDLSDREIYNDIRAECDIWAILELHPDITPDFFEAESTTQTKSLPPSEGVHASVEVFYFEAGAGEEGTYFTDASISEMTILPISGLSEAECEAIEAGTRFQGEYYDGLCHVGVRPSRVRIYSTSYSSDHPKLWVYVRNEYGLYGNSNPYTVEVTVTAEYYKLDPDQRYFKLRALDETSILKYGRRVMDLTWPLGQTPEQMQEIIDLYLERYAEPVCFANIKMLGKTAELQKQILGFDISDILLIVQAGLNLNTEFFINNINCRHDVSGCLEGTFDLEEVRDMER